LSPWARVGTINIHDVAYIREVYHDIYGRKYRIFSIVSSNVAIFSKAAVQDKTLYTLFKLTELIALLCSLS